MHELRQLSSAISGGERRRCRELVAEALTRGIPPRVVLEVLLGAMDEVRRRFVLERSCLPRTWIACGAMLAAREVLDPALAAAGLHPRPTVVIGTVRGEVHDLGKTLVAMMLRGANCAVVDLGASVGPEKFIEAARWHSAAIIGLSAMLTSNLHSLHKTIRAIHGAEYRGRILIGGAATGAALAERVGAHGYAEDAAAAVEWVKSM